MRKEEFDADIVDLKKKKYEIDEKEFYLFGLSPRSWNIYSKINMELQKFDVLTMTFSDTIYDESKLTNIISHRIKGKMTFEYLMEDVDNTLRWKVLDTMNELEAAKRYWGSREKNVYNCSTYTTFNFSMIRRNPKKMTREFKKYYLTIINNLAEKQKSVKFKELPFIVIILLIKYLSLDCNIYGPFLIICDEEKIHTLQKLYSNYLENSSLIYHGILDNKNDIIEYAFRYRDPFGDSIENMFSYNTLFMSSVDFENNFGSKLKDIPWVGIFGSKISENCVFYVEANLWCGLTFKPSVFHLSTYVYDNGFKRKESNKFDNQELRSIVEKISILDNNINSEKREMLNDYRESHITEYDEKYILVNDDIWLEPEFE